MIAPLEAAFEDRAEHAIAAVLAATASLIAAGSLVALFISENSTLFGFFGERLPHGHRGGHCLRGDHGGHRHAGGGRERDAERRGVTLALLPRRS